MTTALQVQRLFHDAKLPTPGTPGSVGLDVYAYLKTETGRPSRALIPPRNSRLIRTGLRLAPPLGYAIFVCSRSGLAAKHSLFVANAPGVVDPDYRGELLCIVYNGGIEAFYVEHEWRIAQIVMLPCVPTTVVEAELDTNTVRGENGFGSTGQ